MSLFFLMAGCAIKAHRADLVIHANSIEDICPYSKNTTMSPAVRTREVFGDVLYDAGGPSLAGTGVPLPDVRVVVHSSLDVTPVLVYIAATNDKGEFRLENVPPGAYTLRTCFDGYDAVELPLTVLFEGFSDKLTLLIGVS
jgi:hypothetical protein